MSLEYLRRVPIKQITRPLHCTNNICSNIHKCNLLVVGGGSGGCSVAWRMRKIFKNSTIILEPSKIHYYQPGFTLIASGVRHIKDCQKATQSVLPQTACWINDSAEVFDPCNNIVRTTLGKQIKYDFMVVAVGIQNDYSKIPGLQRSLDDPNSKVCTIYSPIYSQKTWCLIQQFGGGHAIFTFPKIAGKCAGASLKIAYMAHDYWRKHKILNQTSMMYNTANTATMGLPIYSTATHNLLVKRNVAINYSTDLVEVKKDCAVFVNKCGEQLTIPFNFLHVTPLMSPPESLQRCEQLVDDAGYLDVDHHTMQHKRFPNVFGLGDCTSTPNSKTAAAVAPQSHVLAQNLTSQVYGKPLTAKYDGYGACPIITSYKRGILAEYKYDKKLAHTFPFDQTKERRILYQLVKHVYPPLYWNFMLKGKWNGPGKIRKLTNPFNR